MWAATKRTNNCDKTKINRTFPFAQKLGIMNENVSIKTI